MKILRITTEINRSSIGRTTEQIGSLVLSEGWESYIAWGRNDGKSESKKIHIGNKLSVFSHVLMTRLFDLHGFGSYISTKIFIRELARIKPDIIHLHDIHGYYLNVKLLFKFLKEYDIPVVWTHHDCWAFTGHCAFYSSVDCNKWITGCNNCPLYKEYPRSIFIDNSKLNYKLKKSIFLSLNNLYNVGVSEWISEELNKSFLNKYPILTICNGIDTDVFFPNQRNSEDVRIKYGINKEDVVLIGVATSWGERKGLSDYFKLREVLDDNYKIVLIGVTKSLQAKLPSGVVGIPRTDSLDELRDLYSSSDIVLNFANAESFGKTTPEGLACGVPSIVYNCTASPYLVDKDTGVVVDKGDIIAIVNAIREIMSWDKDITIKKCRARACELYSIKNNWPQYISLYKKIMEKQLLKNNTKGNPLF